jgi:hypothetical protein
MEENTSDENGYERWSELIHTQFRQLSRPLQPGESETITVTHERETGDRITLSSSRTMTSQSLGPAPSIKSGIFYGILSAVALALTGFAAWFIVERLDVLAQYIDKAYYIVLVVLGLGAAAFLFGAMRSYGSIKGERFGAGWEFGGPAAFALIVVLAGMELPSSAKPFDLTIRFMGIQPSAEDRAEVDLGVRHDFPEIDRHGDAIVRGVDPTLMSKKIRIGLISNTWRIKDPKDEYVIPSDALIRIQTERKS